MNNKTALTITVFVLALVLLTGCQTPASAPLPGGTEAQSETVVQPEKTAPPEQATQPGIANPASENCTTHGGTLTIEERGDGGQFGVCYFEDNQQCEEWALLHGDCPVGGVKVTGYVTPAGRYCAITGGEYAVTEDSGDSGEQGACAFKDGSQCDAWDYYNGECTPGAAPATAGATIQPLTMEVCNGQAQAMSHALDDLVPTQSEAPLEDFITGAKGTGCQATVTGSGAQFESPDAVVKSLGSLLAEQGWTEDMMLAAGGPTGMGAGYRKGEQLCYASAMWQPDDSANCPQDQPISACQVTPEQQIYTVTLTCGVESPEGQAAGDIASDPLPSWNAGPAKDTILKFVADVTDPSGASYVPPEERIAVFDNDGTLWTEQPIPAQAAFVFARIAELAAGHPEWKTTQPYQAVLEQDAEALASLSEAEVTELIAVTHAGMPVEEFMDLVQAFLKTARHPRFDALYTETVYQPMLELLALLHANGFKNFVVSGGGAEFMRAFSEPVYGIPPENVIGSSLQYEFLLTENGPVLMRLAEIATFNNAEIKPVNIQRVIGRRPILAAGNSDGDLAMFQYTGAGSEPSLVLLLVHDDAEREYDYLQGTDAVMTAAAQSPWMFVSMKRDFAKMFPKELMR